jgi:toxin ParE1/3/4
MPKRRKVSLSDDALADLEGIGDHIATDSPKRARSFVRELRSACLALAEMSERFAPVEGGDGMRRRPYGSYGIFYDVEQDRVFVLRILNAARDTESALRLED